MTVRRYEFGAVGGVGDNAAPTDPHLHGVVGHVQARGVAAESVRPVPG